jgi:hypothetical protein
MARKAFFGLSPFPEVEAKEFRHYRHFDEIAEMLAGNHPTYKSRILLGMSRLLSAPGYSSEGLAIGQTDAKTGWTVIKLLDSEQFVFSFLPTKGKYLETIHDRVALKVNGKEIELSLDSLEIILRAADGYLIQDQQSSTIRFEIAAFADRISRESTSVIQLISSVGSATTVAVSQGKIKKVGHTNAL